MPDDKIAYRVVADTSPAVAEYMKFVQAEREATREARNLARETKELDRTQREQARSMSRLVEGAGSLVKALGIGTGVAGVIAMVTKNMGDWKASMDGAARSTNEAAKSLVTFAQLQGKGSGGVRAREVSAVGAGFGMAPAEALELHAAIQGQVGDYKVARAAFEQVGMLRRAGAATEAAREGVLLGMGRGEDPGRAARSLFAASIVSGRPIGDIAGQAGTGLVPFRGIGGGMETGLAMMAQLSSAVPADQLGTYTSQVGTALRDRKFWRRFGFAEAGKDPLAQFEALAARGISTEEQLEKAGMGGERGRRGMNIILADLPGLRAKLGKIQRMAADPMLMQRAWQQTGQVLPEVTTAVAIERAEATLKGEQIFGQGLAGQERELRERARALWLQRRGRGQEVPETGRMGWWDWGFANIGAGDPIVAESAKYWTGRTGATRAEAEAGVAQIILELRGSIEHLDATIQGKARTVHNQAGDE